MSAPANPALATLLAQAERERDAAMGALAQADRQAQRLQTQAEQLHQYRCELRQRQPGSQGQATAIDRLQVHQGFAGRLEDVIDQQQAQRLAAIAQVDRQRQALLALELRVASVRKLLGRRAEQQRLVQQQRDQRQTDDSAQRQHRHGGNDFALPHAKDTP